MEDKMEDFKKWCKRYEYDSKSNKAKEDYKKYCDNLIFFRNLKEDKK